MEDIIEHLTGSIRKIIFNWTSKFYHTLDYVDHKDNTHNFLVEFSLPTKLIPVPVAKVKVYFMAQEHSTGDFEMTYRFENQSLVHKVDCTLRTSQVEKWIERLLKEKELTRGVLFMGTEFEAERIKNDKIDFVYQEAVMNPIAVELKRLNDSLLSSSIDYTKSESSLDEKTLDALKDTMFDFFRTVDKNDMGSVSYEECSEILKAMGVQLSEIELNNLMLTADKDANGMIDYKEFVPFGAEILYGLHLKQQTLQEMTLEEEMMVNQAILVLYNDEIHDLTAILIADCKQLDEGNYNTIETAQLKELFKNHSGILTEKEYELLYKKIEAIHPQTFPYAEITNFLLKFKVDVVKGGLMEGNVTLLEKYLRKLFEIFDSQKTGMIPVKTMADALSKAEKIVLSKMQLYILKNFVEKDAEGNVNYIKQSKFLAEMIKKFFNPSVLKKQAQFVKDGVIDANLYMEGWTQEAITNQMNEIFQSFDMNKDKLLNKEEYFKLIKQSGVNMGEEEVYAMMDEADKNKDGFLDFNEFQNHFYNIVKLIRRSKALYKITELSAGECA